MINTGNVAPLKIPLRNQGDYFLTLKTTNMKSVE